jgi:hypothetical protein
METNIRSFDIKKATETIGKSKKAIYSMKLRMGLKTVPNWSKDEIEILLNNSIEDSSIILNKSKNSCRLKKWRLLRNQ